MGACQPSRWGITLVDVHALGPVRGLERAWRKASFLPSSAHLSGGGGFETCDRKNVFCMKFNCLLEGMISMLQLTFLSYFFLIQLAWCCIGPSFLHFLLLLESWRKLYVVLHCYWGTFYSSVLSNTHKAPSGSWKPVGVEMKVRKGWQRKAGRKGSGKNDVILLST